MKKYAYLLVIGIVVFLVMLFFGGKGGTEVAPLEEVPAVQPTPVAPAPVQQPTQPPLDSDRDGLTDEREQSLGTSAFSIDTDADGLYDREEVEVWLTDPLDPDTDNDSYLDGTEVSNGFDPKGPGKIIQDPKS